MSACVDFDPVFLISHDRIRKIAKERASRLNREAKLVGQPALLKPSELIDMYYRLKGRCAISTFPVEDHRGMSHPRSIELDHIVECRKREQIAGAICGVSQPAGLIADVNNVQWVCRFANQLKQYAKTQNVDLAEMCSAVASQASAGYPLRANADFLGFAGRAVFRERIIRECMASSAVCSVNLVLDRLRGTPGEASYAVVHEHMRELGWSDSRPTYENLREEAIRQVVDSHGTHWCTFLDFYNEFCEELKRANVWRTPAKHLVRKQVDRLGIVLSFDRRLRDDSPYARAQPA